MRLSDALNVQRGEVVAFTGAGGKTSALLRLGHELHEAGWRVLATTTTRIAESELGSFPHPLRLSRFDSPQQLSELLSQHGFVFLYSRLRDGKVIGIEPEIISQLADSVDSDAILIEADGSRQLPLKAPYDHEPVIPEDATLVVPVAGMDAVGQPLNEQTVYNVQRVVEHYGFPLKGIIQPAWIAQIIRDESLGLQNISDRARIIPLLNKTGKTVRDRLKARRAAQLILHQPRIEAVAIGQAQRKNDPIWEVQRRVGAVVLAGGLSKRMGRSKPLLPWGNQTVIETVVRRLLPLPLVDIMVVTGYKAGTVKATLHGSGARTVYNSRFASGEMISSLKAGLEALDPTISACLVVLGDQPQLSPRLVNDILTAYAEGQGTLVAPHYRGQRGHPILIDRRYWSELLALPEGSAPREVINAYPQEIALIQSKDDSILRDLDTPEQYQAALRQAGLL